MYPGAVLFQYALIFPCFFFCSTALMVSWQRSMVSDPKCEDWAMLDFLSDKDEQGEMPR